MTQLLETPVSQTPVLLIVEDSDEDFETLQRFLGRLEIAIPIHRCVSGDEALAFLYQTGSYKNSQKIGYAGMIVLDLNLPGTDGREVLRRIKQDDNLKAIPIVVFTTSNNPKDLEVCHQYGVNKYMVKPINFAQLKREVQKLVDYWFEVKTLPDCLKD